MKRFIRRTAAKTTRLQKNESGAMALIAGLAAIPVFLAAGAAVDYGNWVAVDSRLQAAVDAAALAAARASNKTEVERKQIASDYFHSNFGKPKNAGTPTVNMTIEGDGVINVTGQVTVNNYLTSVVGMNSTALSASSQVKREAQGLEVALVFDNTGSMGNEQRLSTLKTASKKFVDILYGPKTTSDSLKIAVVPFSQFVNVGPDKADEAWLDTGGLSPQSGANFLNANWHNWRAWNKISNRSWTGCVEARSGSMAVDDTVPDPNNGATLFTPAFAPDEPDLQGYANNYLADSRTNTIDRRQRHQGKYNDANVTSTSSGPDKGCNIQPILPLNNVKKPVIDTLEAMQANGYTHVAEGVAWGLRVLSPEAPFSEGTAWSDKKIIKSMVLLTDGENTFDSRGNHNQSTYTAYGYLDQARLGSSNYWTAVAAQNTLLQQACSNVKAKEIVVYSFAYKVPSATQRDLIKACASDPEKYFDPPTNAALVSNFEQIADELRRLHLSK
jgi:Flp pilus assembly protein TadG